MKKNERLSAKQLKFAEAYIETGNATEAAIQAGYKESHARQAGSTTLNKPKVKAYIQKKMDKLADERIPSQKEILAKLGDIVTGRAKNYILTKGGLEPVPPSLKDVVAASKELLKRFPETDPIGQAQLRKLNAEADLAESKINETQDSASQLSKSMSKMSDSDLKKLVDGLKEGD